jgi:fumarylacetoacetate (FAA) hydrolase
MKLATLATGERDGKLAVVSTDGTRYLEPRPAITMQEVIEHWYTHRGELEALSARVNLGEGVQAVTARFAAPLPRAWQWLDGSAFESHGALMQKAFKLDPIETDKPLMYQGMSHEFLGPEDDVPFLREEDGIDFEGEFGVVVDDVPMGISPAEASQHIKLLVLINDWSLRTIAPKEMKTGFGWIQAKPACSMAPFAVTPEELGESWSNGRVALPLRVAWNGKQFGNAHGGEMSVGFHDLVAHAAGTRRLCAGTIIGSGTVANANYADVGSSCISERRGSEIVNHGEPRTPFMSFGDTVFMETRAADGSSLFGAINQRVVKAEASK